MAGYPLLVAFFAASVPGGDTTHMHDLLTRAHRARSATRHGLVALAAVFVGMVSYTVAGRLRVPPLVVVVSAVVPMLLASVRQRLSNTLPATCVTTPAATCNKTWL